MLAMHQALLAGTSCLGNWMLYVKVYHRLMAVYLDVGFELPVFKKLSFVLGRHVQILCRSCAWKINLQIAADMGLVMAVSVGSWGCDGA